MFGKKVGSELLIPLRDRIPSEHFPVMTVALIIVNTLLFLHEISLGPAGMEAFFRQYGLIPAQIPSGLAVGTWGNYSPVLTSMFLHGGWMHLIGNMWALWLFGDNVEDRMGPVKFLVFYILCGVLAAVTHIYVNPASPDPTVGASGAIAGVMGAYFLLYPGARVLTLIPIIIFPWLVEIPAFIYLGIWMLIQIQGGAAALAGGAVQIAFWAHIGGFIAGMLLHRWFMNRSLPQPYA
jgi:membrane associated rhomboid family serine protease